ncbi:MAG: RNA-dependent DNA polymerase [gamma proteobacterium endosymbiont of Lamellibrachia anaximandri]|nr:RNA-dependent DNA polymerase [gamma proteobacterium endosymbiont of Lamellibrachia anaximandri]
MPSYSTLFTQICDWENLLLAYRKASRGKRGHPNVAQFDFRQADELLKLRESLLAGSYRPGSYVNFHIHEPKRRKISAAPFRDRVVHHALCNLLEPRFERHFIPDSYANRVDKGTHRAVDRLQGFSQRFRYILRADIVKHFPSIDHTVLKEILHRQIEEDDVMVLVRTIIDSGAGVLDDEYEMQWFPQDDLLATCRPRGLPIGNLTSQFWSNCYLDPFDHFVKRELGCQAYLRYVDDFALFSNNKAELWAWKRAIIERLQRFRLVIHESAAQVLPVECGIPWLGFVVYPTHRRIKSRKVRNATRHLGQRMQAWRQGKISFAELDAGIQGWVNHVRYADSWGLRRSVFNRLAARGR